MPVHATAKIMKIICIYSKISGYLYKKCSCLQHTKCQNILIYNFLFKHKSKDQSYKINYTFNGLVFLKQDMFLKLSQLSVTNGPRTQKLQGIFSLTNKFSFNGKVQSALCHGATSHGPLEITHFVSTNDFFGGVSKFITPKY